MVGGGGGEKGRKWVKGRREREKRGEGRGREREGNTGSIKPKSILNEYYTIIKEVNHRTV